MEIVTVSGHALERFREHERAADVAAVLVAARMAIPIGSELAHMIVGRPRRAAEARDAAEHRVHLTGAGIFVLCPIVALPGRLYVKTYLRLASVVQRDMVARWFLNGISPVTAAFELGFRAAREAPASVSEGEAVEAHASALLQLAAHFGSLRTPETTQAGAPAQAGPPPPPPPLLAEPAADSTPSCLSPTRAAVGEIGPPVIPDRVVDGVGWTDAAFKHREWFRGLDAAWESDLSKWRALSSAEQATLREGTHLGPLGPANAIWLEPEGRAVALVVEGEPPVVYRLSTVPRAVRPRLGLPARVPTRGAIRPAPATRFARPVDGGEGHAPTVPSPRPGPAPTFVAADAARASHWTPRAKDDAHEAGLSEIPAQWLTCLESVAVDACAALAASLGWGLVAGRRYALRRGTGYVVLLAETGLDGRYAVARCARDPDA
ncbi:hypothetical protein L6V77_29990 [Myxococcota bacterium]|nr:hypothetical protein [Myxococcota bacterium]